MRLRRVGGDECHSISPPPDLAHGGVHNGGSMGRLPTRLEVGASKADKRNWLKLGRSPDLEMRG